MASNLVFGNYVTSATFCLKLGKSELAALGLLSQAGELKDSTDASFWSLGSKGLIKTSADRSVTLTDAGELAVKLLKVAGLLT